MVPLPEKVASAVIEAVAEIKEVEIMVVEIKEVDSQPVLKFQTFYLVSLLDSFQIILR